MAPMMTQSDFDSIPLGCDVEMIEERFGTPFDVNPLSNDVDQYRYVHRFDVNSDKREQLEYLFNVRSGKVIDKQCRKEQTTYINPIY